MSNIQIIAIGSTLQVEGDLKQRSSVTTANGSWNRESTRLRTAYTNLTDRKPGAIMRSMGSRCVTAGSIYDKQRLVHQIVPQVISLQEPSKPEEKKREITPEPRSYTSWNLCSSYDYNADAFKPKFLQKHLDIVNSDKPFLAYVNRILYKRQEDGEKMKKEQDKSHSDAILTHTQSPEQGFRQKEQTYLYEGFNVKIKMFLTKDRRGNTTGSLPSIYEACQMAAREQALKYSSGQTLRYEAPSICRVMCSSEDQHNEPSTRDDLILSNLPNKNDGEPNRNGLKGMRQHLRRSNLRDTKQITGGLQKPGKENLNYDHKLVEMITPTKVTTPNDMHPSESKTPLIIDMLSDKVKSHSGPPRTAKDPTVFPYVDNLTGNSHIEKRHWNKRLDRSRHKTDFMSDDLKIPAINSSSQGLVLDDLLATEMCSYEPRTYRNDLDWKEMSSKKLNKSSSKTKTEKEPRYSDPFVGASSSFQSRIADIATLEAETIRYERTKKSKRKAND